MARAAALMVCGALAVLAVAGGCERAEHPPAAASAPTSASAPGATSPPTAPARPALSAASIAVDGVKLGDRFGRLFHRPPYDRPCDDDPVDSPHTRRALVYGALPCRGNAFPDGTTAVFVVDWAEPDDFDQPIRAIGWIGGHYFDSRTRLPLRVGAPAAGAEKVLGPVRDRLPLSRRTGLIAWRFDGDIYALVDGSLLAGFVLGPMPADATTDDWRVYEQMYRKYTRPVGAGPAKVSREDCLRVLRHADELIGQDPDHPRPSGVDEREINQCLAHATPAMITCALAAKTYEQVRACAEEP